MPLVEATEAVHYGYGPASAGLGAAVSCLEAYTYFICARAPSWRTRRRASERRPPSANGKRRNECDPPRGHRRRRGRGTGGPAGPYCPSYVDTALPSSKHLLAVSSCQLQAVISLAWAEASKCLKSMASAASDGWKDECAPRSPHLLCLPATPPRGLRPGHLHDEDDDDDTRRTSSSFQLQLSAARGGFLSSHAAAAPLIFGDSRVEGNDDCEERLRTKGEGLRRP